MLQLETCGPTVQPFLHFSFIKKQFFYFKTNLCQKQNKKQIKTVLRIKPTDLFQLWHQKHKASDVVLIVSNMRHRYAQR